MLTRLTVRRFKLFEEIDIELGQRVVLVGPNNSGKTSALQALALWDIGIRRWVEKRGISEMPRKRPGVTINRRDLVNVPVPSANLLWKNLRVREGVRENEKQFTRNLLIEIIVSGESAEGRWECGLEFDYANEEAFYCRPLQLPNGNRMPVPKAVEGQRIAYLPPMSGLMSSEVRLDFGAIQVRLGEGRTAEVLRNLCYQVFEKDRQRWRQIVEQMHMLFGIRLEEPRYVVERGEIELFYKTPNGVRLELVASGRGQQQTLLLLAHMWANPGAVILIDEPDAHLEILRQRQIYTVLSETAAQTSSQIIAASHSEVLLNEAADRDVVIAFVGKPHRIDDRGNQVLKALKEIGFEHYLLAEQKGWVLYLEGATDLNILRAFAQRLNHDALPLLERPFVVYVGNQPRKAQDHFYGVREAKPDLKGIAIFDRLDRMPPEDPNLYFYLWQRREIENYLCQRETLLTYAREQGRTVEGDLFAPAWEQIMEQTIAELTDALRRLNKPDPFEGDLKVSDEFLTPLFENFYQKLERENVLNKTDFHVLAQYVPAEKIDPEVRAVLDAIVDTARQSNGLEP